MLATYAQRCQTNWCQPEKDWHRSPVPECSFWGPNFPSIFCLAQLKYYNPSIDSKGAEVGGSNLKPICTKGGASMEFSERILKERERLELVQVDFAELCGVEQACVSHWEVGRTVPEQAKALLAYLSCIKNRPVLQDPAYRRHKAELFHSCKALWAMCDTAADLAEMLAAEHERVTEFQAAAAKAGLKTTDKPDTWKALFTSVKLVHGRITKEISARLGRR